MEREKRWLAWFVLLVGLALLTMGVASMIWGNGDRVPAGSSCRALCGLFLLIGETVGASGGFHVFIAIQLVLGIVGTGLGVRLLRGG